MNNESLKNYMLNEYDYLPDTYVIEDAEKRELLRKLSLMITDRRDKKKLEDIVDNDPEMWCLDKIMNKDEVKFMLSFEKKRVNKFNVQQLAKRNSMTPEQAQKMADGLCETGILEFDRDNKKKEKQYFVPKFEIGRASCRERV